MLPYNDLAIEAGLTREATYLPPNFTKPLLHSELVELQIKVSLDKTHHD